MREAFLRSRAELFYLISVVLSDRYPEWRCDAVLLSGLVLADCLGWATVTSERPEDKAEVANFLRDLRPICESVLREGTPMQKPQLARGTIQ